MEKNKKPKAKKQPNTKSVSSDKSASLKNDNLTIKQNEDNNKKNNSSSSEPIIENEVIEDLIKNELKTQDKSNESSNSLSIHKSIDWHSNSQEIDRSKIMINIQDLKKSYGRTEILHGINLKIYEGERVAIIGPNGAGKSTLSEIIAGVKQKTSGTIEYSFGNTKHDISRNIGIQFQESTYPMFVKVDAIIKFFIEAAGMKLEKDKLDHLLDLFNLKDIYKKMAEGLSGGQKQRMNILLSVIHEPKLLILDEVSTGLDVETRTNVKAYIKQYLEESKATSIIVSHNTDEVMALADRIIVIYDGNVYLDRPLKSIIDEYGNFDNFIDELFLKQFKKLKEEKGDNK